jgi:hypothetical protein
MKEDNEAVIVPGGLILFCINLCFGIEVFLVFGLTAVIIFLFVLIGKN